MTECSICCDETLVQSTCNECEIVMCIICLENYIELNKSEKMGCKCAISNCKGEFLFDSVPLALINDYNDSLFSYLGRIYIEKIGQKNSENGIIEKLVKKRLEFVEANFPEAIKHVAIIAFKRKLVSIKNSQVKDFAKKVNKNCFNYYCKGKIDSDTFECMACATKFCEKCEKKNDKLHKCNPDDIASVNALNQIIRCPNPACSIQIIREYGCDMMTCSVCRTNFNYTNGRVTLSGNHNQHEKFDIIKERRLRDSYTVGSCDELVMNAITQIENLEPKVYSIDSFVKILTDVKCGSNSLSKEYQKFKNSSIKVKRYFRIIEGIIYDGNPKMYILQGIIDELKR